MCKIKRINQIKVDKRGWKMYGELIVIQLRSVKLTRLILRCTRRSRKKINSRHILPFPSSFREISPQWDKLSRVFKNGFLTHHVVKVSNQRGSERSFSIFFIARKCSYEHMKKTSF